MDATIWPLGVAGYAASKGQILGTSFMASILGSPGYKISHITHALPRQLNKFWLYPGEGKWDDCWGDTFLFPL